MQTQQWSQAKAIFQAALQQPLEERAQFVASQCPDAALRAEVLHLLALHDGASEFLETPLDPDQAATAPRGDPLVGRRIGGFQLLRRIGTGGMGAVYEAQQEQPRRRVAIKVLRSSFATPQMMRRFEFESEILAKLRHPGIASVLAAGTFELGDGAQPWFAMELVEGPPLTTYVQEYPTNARGRIELLLGVCAAVQHAHQQGVVHRDLKPANILVVHPGATAPHGGASGAEAEAAAMPKVLDFGVARASDPELQVTMHTAVGQLVGTLNYMSPEQLSANPDDVDARSDVYALGVIGYELLTGSMPHGGRSGSMSDLIRAIEHEEPRRLGAVDPALRGDLEAIFSKALEKDRTRRYQSAAELAAELRRFLNDEPVLARTPTAMYQLRKFAQRNRALVGGVLATIIALTAGVIMYASKARQAQHEAERSRYEADKATAINNFMTNDFLMKLLAAANAADAGQRLPVAELVDRAAENVGVMFAGQPLAEAAVRNEIGTVYYNLSAHEQAAEQFSLALAGWESQLGPDHADTLKAVNNLGQSYAHLRRTQEAEALYRRAFEGRLRVLGEDDPFTLTSMSNLANLYRWTGRLDEAEAMMRRSLEIQRRVQGETHKNTLINIANLGTLLLERGSTDEALRLHRQVYETTRTTLGVDHVTTLMAGSRLALTLRKAGALAEAKDLQLTVLASLERTFGPAHRDTIGGRRLLARIEQSLGQTDEAAQQLAMALEALEAQPGHSAELAGEIRKELADLKTPAEETPIAPSPAGVRSSER